jgi:hypothetical protein
MFQRSITELVQVCAGQLQEAKRDLHLSHGVDRVLMSESRTAIESSVALLRVVRRQEDNHALRRPADPAGWS